MNAKIKKPTKPKEIRKSDALRLINKCRRMYPELDFTNITIVDYDNYQYRFGKESSGICRGNGDIKIRIPIQYVEGGYLLAMTYAAFMGTLVHEAIHRDVLFNHGLEHHNHGIEFQKRCLYFGLDPIKEVSGDDRVIEKIYPMNAEDYLKYRSEYGERNDPIGDTDAEWAYEEKHDKTYSRKCPAYDAHMKAVLPMRLCHSTNEDWK